MDIGIDGWMDKWMGGGMDFTGQVLCITVANSMAEFTQWRLNIYTHIYIINVSTVYIYIYMYTCAKNLRLSVVTSSAELWETDLTLDFKKSAWGLYSSRWSVFWWSLLLNVGVFTLHSHLHCSEIAFPLQRFHLGVARRRKRTFENRILLRRMFPLSIIYCSDWHFPLSLWLSPSPTAAPFANKW